jgi:hypothetical protein
VPQVLDKGRGPRVQAQLPQVDVDAVDGRDAREHEQESSGGREERCLGELGHDETLYVHICT